METWTLGDRTVNRIGFGAMRVRGAPSREQAIAVLRQAVRLGVNHIDTAAFYFSALLSANELIHSALPGYPDDLLIATKVGPWRDTWGAWQGMARPEQLRGQVEENLRQLGRDRFDLVYLRMLPGRSITEYFAALAEVRDAGLIRHLGISNVTLPQLDEAVAIAPVVAVQNRYAVDTRRPDADDVLRACGERGIAFVPYFTIVGEGREGSTRPAETTQVLAVARGHGASAAQVRLAWTLAQGRHVLAIPGTSNPEHLAENVAAATLHLSADDLTVLASIQPGLRPGDRRRSHSAETPSITRIRAPPPARTPGCARDHR